MENTTLDVEANAAEMIERLTQDLLTLPAELAKKVLIATRNNVRDHYNETAKDLYRRAESEKASAEHFRTLFTQNES